MNKESYDQIIDDAYKIIGNLLVKDLFILIHYQKKNSSIVSKPILSSLKNGD